MVSRRIGGAALEAGFNFHLTKPASIADLEDLLLKLPQRSRAVPEAAIH